MSSRVDMQLSISAPSIKYIARCTLVHLDAESSAGSSHGGIQQGCRFLLIGRILSKHSATVCTVDQQQTKIKMSIKFYMTTVSTNRDVSTTSISIYLLSGWFIAFCRVLPFIEFGDLSDSSTSCLVMINSIAIGLVILCFVPSSVNVDFSV